jgi:hypothetical protein
MMFRLLALTNYLYMLLALSSRKKDNPNDTSISDSRRCDPDWNTSRFGLSHFGLFVSEMVQYLSLQKD